MEIIACVEIAGVRSDPLVIALTLGVAGAVGRFELPARFAGSLVEARGPWLAHLHGGEIFRFHVERFDIATGVAEIATTGPLPFAKPKRA